MNWLNTASGLDKVEEAVLTRESLTRGAVMIAKFTQAHSERFAFSLLGGLGFAAHRKARRERLWKQALDIGECARGNDGRVVIAPHGLVVPLSLYASVRALVGASAKGGGDE